MKPSSKSPRPVQAPTSPAEDTLLSANIINNTNRFYRKSCYFFGHLNHTILPAIACPLFSVFGGAISAQSVNLSAISATLGPGFVINGHEGTSESGHSVSSAGDVNGDGLADVILGAPNAAFAGASFAGRSYVVFGKSSFPAIELSDVASGTSALGFVINGHEGSGFSGASVSAAGDVNGDGLADVIVGAFNSRPGGLNGAGRSYVVFGKTGGAAVNLSAVVTGTSALGFVINGQAADDHSGWSVCSAGDVNGDGLADLIVGADNSDPPTGGGGNNKAGRSYVVFGKTSSAAVNLVDLTSGGSSLGFVINGQAAGDYAGFSVSSAGDVNGDGLADLIVAADRSDPSFSNAGRSYVVFGKADTTAVNLVDLTSGTSSLGFVINGQTTNDRSGNSVSSAGDVNGDGLCDLIVGAYRSDPPAGSYAGRSYVVFGKSSSIAVNLVNLTTGSSTMGFAINGQAVGDYAGYSVSAAGDVNGDGLADVIVGAKGSDPAAGSGAGRSYVVFGKTSGTVVDLSAVATGTSGTGFILNGQAANDISGRSVSSAGDVNGDGLADVIVGAPHSDPGALLQAGRSYVVFSPLTPATSGTYRSQVAAGNPDRQGIGVHRFGDDEVIFPDSRAWVDFDGGNGTGLANSSEVVATITRNDSGLTGFDPANVADVQWQFTTNRTGWAACRVTVRYTDAEIAGLSEGSLALYSAPTTAGPFTATGSFLLDATRNEGSGNVTSMPRVLVLVGAPAGANGDANSDGSVNAADVTAIHNQLAGITPPPLAGDGDIDNDGDVDLDDVGLLIGHIINSNPLP